MMDRATSKPIVLVVMLAAASLILVSGSQEWVSGSVDDAVLGASALHAAGSDIAPGVLAAALVGLAAAVAAATSGVVVRFVAACAALLAAVLGVTKIISVLADPGGALGALAAAGTGRGGTLAARGQVGGWVWVALGAMVVMGVGGLVTLARGRHWHGLSSRYGAPVADPTQQPSPAGETGETGHGSAWDQLSRGQDPTVGD